MPMYLSAEQAATFVSRLFELTEDEKAKWLPEFGSEYSFQITLKNFTYIVRSKDADDFHPFVLEIQERFRAADGTSSVRDLQQIDADDPEYTRAYSYVAELYALIKRKTFGYDTKAVDIMESLDDLD